MNALNGTKVRVARGREEHFKKGSSIQFRAVYMERSFYRCWMIKGLIL